MADAVRAIPVTVPPPVPRHAAFVRITHWITALCFLALLGSGTNIVISHPRFYWGEAGNVLTSALFELPIPASRSYVRTGYNFVMPDQNGWSRSLHFQTAWILVITGILYVVRAVATRHVRTNLLPSSADLTPRAMGRVVRSHLRLSAATDPAGQHSYNVLQRLTYLSVTLVLCPVMIWTGLAMSPAVVSVAPGMVDILGGHQSARTIHFVVTVLLVLFLVVHVGMVYLAGFRKRTWAMISGNSGGER